jgi:hypothetical protein
MPPKSYSDWAVMICFRRSIGIQVMVVSIIGYGNIAVFILIGKVVVGFGSFCNGGIIRPFGRHQFYKHRQTFKQNKQVPNKRYGQVGIQVACAINIIG